ncbi:hypothetical protein E2562_003715 [Oryza meyeriana var. granulata]|uniref:Uncharacterized protein n=1 Tax=Oryza meyeriana var. granulata TaxID=110450 RepID=A0A6G1C479_9ORYZ|nr:hypothetical protein E2562_003715 [Oryza meyeriana var. granulata]
MGKEGSLTEMIDHALEKEFLESEGEQGAEVSGSEASGRRDPPGARSRRGDLVVPSSRVWHGWSVVLGTRVCRWLDVFLSRSRPPLAKAPRDFGGLRDYCKFGTTL